MKALALVALLALVAGAHANMGGLDISETNGTKTVKLAAKTIELTPELSLPRLPKIDVPGASLLNKTFELPSIPKPNVLALLMAAKPNMTMGDLAGALSGLSNLVSKPSVDYTKLLGFISMMMADNMPTMPSMPTMDMSTLTALLGMLPKKNMTAPSLDMSTLTALLGMLPKKNMTAPSLNLDLTMLASLLEGKNLTLTLPTMPNMPNVTMPTIDLSALASMALKKPSVNLTMPDLSALKSLAHAVEDVNITWPAMHELAKQLAAVRPSVELPEVTISMPAKNKVDVAGIINELKSHKNASADEIMLILQTLHASRPNFTMPTLSMPQMPTLDISTLAALAAAKPNVDLSGLTDLANDMLNTPMPKLNLTVPDVAALATLAGKSLQNLNMTLPQMPEKVSVNDLLAAAQGVTSMARSVSADALKTEAIMSWLNMAGFTSNHTTMSKQGNLVVDLGRSL